MTKRLRTLETLGNLPYTTIDGGRWLKKALDPADIDVEIAGLPDTTTNARTVLNYQFQGDIPLPSPSTYDANIIQSYDVDFYVYQNPVVFGMSVSRPAGLKPLGGGCVLRFLGNGEISVDDGYAPANVQVFENSQIEGDYQNAKLENLEKYCQKFRMIYGGVQCIPACSALFDSGTIEATQQIFSPKDESVSNMVDGNGNLMNTITPCQMFKKNDFPDEGSSIQNPTTLYCRYKEGLYMPYKIRNPLVYDYKSSEQSCVNEAPYVITNEVKVTFTHFQESGKRPTETIDLDFNPATRKFELVNQPEYTVPDVNMRCEWTIGCYSKTGVKFYFHFFKNSPDGTTIKDQPMTMPELLPSYPCLIAGPFSSDNPDMMGYRVSNTIGTNTGAVNKQLPYQECNIGIICFRSIGLQATIRVIFRMGIEMMITAGGIYSPFKHKAPKFDQKALSSYVRTTHCMRDAFLGNAATPEGHEDYANQLALMVASDEGTVVSNLGSGWYGRVSV